MGKYEKLKGAKNDAADEKHDEAISQICNAWIVAFLSWVACVSLWSIGYISLTFLSILCALIACRCVFKTGYFWRDIKF